MRWGLPFFQLGWLLNTEHFRKPISQHILSYIDTLEKVFHSRDDVITTVSMETNEGEKAATQMVLDGDGVAIKVAFNTQKHHKTSARSHNLSPSILGHTHNLLL